MSGDRFNVEHGGRLAAGHDWCSARWGGGDKAGVGGGLTRGGWQGDEGGGG